MAVISITISNVEYNFKFKNNHTTYKNNNF